MKDQEKIKIMLLKEIKSLNISLGEKMKILSLLDWAFRDQSGMTYFSEKEIEKREQLYKSINNQL